MTLATKTLFPLSWEAELRTENEQEDIFREIGYKIR